MKRISLIVPCYNEEESLPLFYEEIVKWLDPRYEMDLVFVNDGSKDQTLNILKDLARKDKRVKYLSFSRNFGKEAAMHAGLTKCQESDAIIMMDADLQHPPYLIPEMIKNWENGYNIVYTKFKTRKGEPLLKRFFARCFYKLFDRYAEVRMENGVKDYQLLDQKVVKAFLQMPDNNRFMKGIFSWVGYKKICLPFEFEKRQAGKTKWSFKKLFKYGFNGMNQFSNVLMLLPFLAIILVILMMITGTALYFTNVWDTNLQTYLFQIKYDFYALILFFLIHMGFYLMYNMRRQILNRPIYLIEEENDD